MAGHLYIFFLDDRRDVLLAYRELTDQASGIKRLDRPMTSSVIRNFRHWFESMTKAAKPKEPRH